MAQRVVFASDLSSKDIPDGERVEIRVLELDGLSQPVKLDASKTEADRLRVESSSLALLELVMPDGESVRLAIPAEQFKKAIRGDADEVLANAEALSFEQPSTEQPRRRRGRPRSDSDSTAAPRPKRDREQLQAMRDWLRAQGHEVSDRGRIRADLEQLYHDAHPDAQLCRVYGILESRSGDGAGQTVSTAGPTVRRVTYQLCESLERVIRNRR